MVVFGYRRDQLGLLRGPAVIGMCAFKILPAKVDPTRRICRCKIDFFPLTLTDIAYVQITGSAVKGDAPGITQAIGPNLVPEWVISRNGIGFGRIHIQAQDLAQESVQFLTVAKGITRRAAVTESNVQVAVRAEGQSTAIMVAKGLIRAQYNYFAGWVGNVWIGCNPITCDDSIPTLIRVVDEEQSILGISWMKGQSEQALFVPPTANTVTDVQIWKVNQSPVLHNTDASDLLDDKQALIARVLNVDGAFEARDNRFPDVSVRVGKCSRIRRRACRSVCWRQRCSQVPS